MATARDAGVPSRKALKAWWERFTKKQEQFQAVRTGEIFGVPLHESIQYANVAISLTDENGHSFVYGYVPVIVAKCGVFLKEKATDVEGIFRLSGSAKRIKDLQTIFNSPDKYGKGLSWEGYTVHDAANILRRYLNNLPEPIIPLEFYDKFRKPLMPPARPVEERIAIYQKLISELPALNRQLLLYILDLLAVFASKSDQNQMTAENLSVIFQPGVISHPSHNMSPEEYAASQEVLVFLIRHQDHFLLGMQGKDDAGVGKDAQLPVSPSIHSRRNTQSFDGFAPNVSPAAEQLKKQGGVRRNASLSSRRTKDPLAASSGVHRSNTLPSKRRAYDSPKVARIAPIKPPTGGHMMELVSPESPNNKENTELAPIASAEDEAVTEQRVEVAKPRVEKPVLPKQDIPRVDITRQPSSPVTTPNKERPFSSFFNAIDVIRGNDLGAGERSRTPSNKLKKKRRGEDSADSSTWSLSANVTTPPPTSNPRPILSPQPTRTMEPVVTPNSPPPTTSNTSYMPTMSPTSSTSSSLTSRASDQDLHKRASRPRWRMSRTYKPGNIISPPFSPERGSPERTTAISPPADRERRYSDNGNDNERRGVRAWLDRQMNRAMHISNHKPEDAANRSKSSLGSEASSQGTRSSSRPRPEYSESGNHLKPTLPTIESGDSSGTSVPRVSENREEAVADDATVRRVPASVPAAPCESAKVEPAAVPVAPVEARSADATL